MTEGCKNIYTIIYIYTVLYTCVSANVPPRWRVETVGISSWGRSLTVTRPSSITTRWAPASLWFKEPMIIHHGAIPQTWPQLARFFFPCEKMAHPMILTISKSSKSSPWLHGCYVYLFILPSKMVGVWCWVGLPTFLASSPHHLDGQKKKTAPGIPALFSGR